MWPQVCWCLLNSPRTLLNKDPWGNFPCSLSCSRTWIRDRTAFPLTWLLSIRTTHDTEETKEQTNWWDELDQTLAKSKQQRETESTKWGGSNVQMQRAHWPPHRSKDSDYLLVCWCSLLDRKDKYFEWEGAGLIWCKRQNKRLALGANHKHFTACEYAINHTSTN